MKKITIKTQKVNKLIQKNLSQIIHEKLYNIKDNLITITDVITSSDLTLSKIFISTLKDEKIILNILNNASKNFRHCLSVKIKLYKIPKIVFIYDEKLNYTTKITNLLNKTIL